MCTPLKPSPLFAYLFSCWWTFGLFLVWGYYKWSCCEPSCINLCMNLIFLFSWVKTWEWIKYMFTSFAYFLRSCFFSYWVLSFLCILNSPLANICFENILSQSVACLFILLIKYFKEKFVVLMKFNLSICSFMDFAFSAVSEKSFLNPRP